MKKPKREEIYRELKSGWIDYYPADERKEGEE